MHYDAGGKYLTSWTLKHNFFPLYTSNLEIRNCGLGVGSTSTCPEPRVIVEDLDTPQFWLSSLVYAVAKASDMQN